MMMGDKLFFVAMIIIPLLIMIAAGYALKFEKLNIIPVAAVDEDDSGYSELLLKRLENKEGLGLYFTDRAIGLSMLENNQAEQIFIIKKGFEESVIKGRADDLIELIGSPSSHSTPLIREIIAGETLRLLMANMAADNVANKYRELGIETKAEFRDEVFAYADGLWEPEPLMVIDYRVMKGISISWAAGTAVPAATASSAGLITAFIMFYMLFSSGWLVEERTNGTIKRLGTVKGAIAASYGGGILALFAVGLLQIIIFSAVQRIFFGIVLFTGAWSWILLLSYLLTVISIGLFLSSVLKTPAQLQAVTPVMALFTGFLGGCFWNFADISEEIRRLSLFTPQGWALKGINGLMQNPGDIAEALAPISVLMTISLILLPVSYIIIISQKDDFSFLGKEFKSQDTGTYK